MKDRAVVGVARGQAVLIVGAANRRAAVLGDGQQIALRVVAVARQLAEFVQFIVAVHARAGERVDAIDQMSQRRVAADGNRITGRQGTARPREYAAEIGRVADGDGRRAGDEQVAGDLIAAAERERFAVRFARAARTALSTMRRRRRMKFPYGIADFHKLITGGYFYADRTGHLPLLEEAGEQLLFLRPRRFGKSLLLSLLENYYDLAKAEEFERLFGHLEIGRHPTPKHNQYFVLKWDFSAVSPAGTPERVREALHNHVNQAVRQFAAYYREQLTQPILIAPQDAQASFQSLVDAVQLSGGRLYLLIDEYDNFANEILMGGRTAGRQRYDGLLQGEGDLKALFKAVKAAAAGRGLDRVFITGVAPLVLSDLTSGYNVARKIDLDPQFQALCGFTEPEIAALLTAVAADRRLPAGAAEHTLTQMRLYYNGYRFSEDPGELIYNPTLGLSAAELRALPAVQQQLAEAREQWPAYRDGIKDRYGTGLGLELRLRAYAVVSVGFERLVWEEMGESI